MQKHTKHPSKFPAETIGIDLGDKISRYCVVDHNGTVVEEGSFRNQASSIERHFAGSPCRVALEAGAQSAWISRELKRLGHQVIVAHARELKWITQSDTKNDPVDARKLALLARADLKLLRPVEHRTAEQQAELGVLRARDAMVRARTLLINTARGIAKGFGVRLPKSITATFGARARAAAPQLTAALGGLLEQIDALSRQVAEADQSIARMAEAHPEVARLAKIPGVGALTGLAFVLTLGRAERFAHSRDAAAYLGLRPRQRQSGARDPQLGITKSGDAYVRRLLVQCAHYIVGPFGPDSALRRWGLAKGLGGGKRVALRAIIGVARKLAVLLHRLWSTGQDYKPFPKMV